MWTPLASPLVETTASSINNAGHLTRGVTVKASSSNKAPVYVSRRSDVTADQTPTGGFELQPGDQMFVPAPSLSSVFFIRGTNKPRKELHVCYMAH